MADNASVIREYLIGLGFKLDRTTLAKWDTALAKTAKQVLAFSTTMAGIAATTTLFVSHMADEFADLYWSSVKVRDSVANVKEFQLQFAKVGGTADSALAALDSMADALRFNPAAEGILHNLGIATRNADGGLRDTKSILLDLAHAPMPEWLKARWAGYFGISTDQLRELERIVPGVDNGMNKLFDDLGLNSKEAQQRMVAFKNSMTDFKAKIDVVGLALGSRLLPAAEGFLKIVNGLIDGLVWLDKNTAGWSTQLLILATVAGAIGLAFGWIPAIIAGLVLIGSTVVGNWDTVKATISEGIEWLRGKYNSVAKFLHLPQWSGSAPEAANDNKHGMPDYQQQEKDVGAWTIVPPPTTSVDGERAPGGKVPLGVRSNNLGNLQPGGTEKVYQNMQQGLKAMADLLVKYSSKGLDTVSKIISKYAPEFDKNGKHINNTAAYIKAVASGLGVDANQHLNLQDNGVLAKFMTLMIRQEQGYLPVGKSMIEQAAANANSIDGRRLVGHGGGSVTINQKTDITVNGSDPESTGRAVAREQGRTNGDMVRNFAGAQN